MSKTLTAFASGLLIYNFHQDRKKARYRSNSELQYPHPVPFNKRYYCNNKQRVQGLQALAFFVVTTDNEHMKPRFKRKLRG